MVNIYEVLQRAVALMQETALNSISPERAGGIMRDTLLALNDLWLQQGSALVISKIYASVAAMEADTAPVSDLTGKPLKPGQIVVIASSDSDNGSVYRYNGTDAPSWSLVGAIGNLTPVDSLDSDSTTLPLAAHQGKVLDGKIGQLGQKVNQTLFTNGDVLVGFGLRGDDGALIKNSYTEDFCCSKEYIPVTVGVQYKWIIGKAITGGGDNGALVFFDSLGNRLIHYSANNTEREITAPENAAFARAVFAVGYDNIGLYDNNNNPIFIPNNNIDLQNKILKNKSDIKSLYSHEDGLNEINVQINKSIDGVRNRIIDYEGAGLSDFFSVTAGVIIDCVFGKTFSGGSDECAIVFYGSNGQKIDYFGAGTAGKHVKVPTGAVKARAGFWLDSEYSGVYELNGDVIFKPNLIEGYQSQINKIAKADNVYFNHGWNNVGLLTYLEGICCSKDYFQVTAGETYTYIIGGAILNGSDNGAIVFYDSANNVIGYLSANAVSRSVNVPQNAVKAKATFMMGIENVGVFDSNNNPVFVPAVVNKNESIGVSINSDVFSRNYDRENVLIASCRQHKLNNKKQDLQLLLITDTHGSKQSIVNAISATNDFDSIDAMIHCGDCITDVFPIGSDQSPEWKDLVKYCNKPFYFIIGNHEKQVYPPILYSPSDAELYNAFIKPSVDAGHLVNGEYTANKCYYYHDFNDRGVRLIVIDENEAPRVIDETYWEAITYNSNLPNYVVGNTYEQNSEVNVPNYTAYSFRAKSQVTVNAYNNTAPSYKYPLGERWISQTQAQWFLDVLASTPSNYQVIVGIHRPFSSLADTFDSSIFNQGHLTDGYGIASYMITDFVAEAINAFQNKSADFSIECVSNHPEDMPSYTVSKNFSSVAGKFNSLIGGHDHRDLIWKHRNYNQYQVTPVCGNQLYSFAHNSDICRSFVDSLAFDSITVMSVAENRIGLVKLGQNITINGTKRDVEVINTEV